MAMKERIRLEMNITQKGRLSEGMNNVIRSNVIRKKIALMVPSVVSAFRSSFSYSVSLMLSLDYYLRDFIGINDV